MNPHERYQHGITTERCLWFVIAVALGLALGTPAAAAKECQHETPLPADVRLIAPGPEVPEAMARFAGAWTVAWLDEGREALCHTLVVEEVFANGYARVIYSVGTHAGWNIRQPQFWRATGRIVDGVLRFHLPVPERPNLAYWFVGEALQGTFKGEGTVSLTRVADLRQVGCGPPAERPPGAARHRAARSADGRRVTGQPIRETGRPQCLLHAGWPGRASLARLERDLDHRRLVHV